eukprot:1061450_1
MNNISIRFRVLLLVLACSCLTISASESRKRKRILDEVQPDCASSFQLGNVKYFKISDINETEIPLHQSAATEPPRKKRKLDRDCGVESGADPNKYWACTACSFNNDRSAQKCHICNAPKADEDTNNRKKGSRPTSFLNPRKTPDGVTVRPGDLINRIKRLENTNNRSRSTYTTTSNSSPSNSNSSTGSGRHHNTMPYPTTPQNTPSDGIEYEQVSSRFPAGFNPPSDTQPGQIGKGKPRGRQIYNFVDAGNPNFAKDVYGTMTDGRKENHQEKLNMLQALGFKASVASLALEQANGDVHKATETLLMLNSKSSVSAVVPSYGSMNHNSHETRYDLNTVDEDDDVEKSVNVKHDDGAEDGNYKQMETAKTSYGSTHEKIGDINNNI